MPRHNRSSRRLLLVLLAASALIGSACGDESEAATVVTIYSGRTENLIGPILEDFADETGIDVQVRYGQSADLALLIAEEGDRSPADVFLSQSPGAVGFLDQQGLLAPLPEDVLELVPAEVRADDGRWVGFSGRQRVLVYNADQVDAAELPDSVVDLTEPEWSGRVGIAPANGSFQDFVTAMRVELGDEATLDFLTGLADNDAVTFANNNAIVAAVGRGEVDVGLVNHYYNHRFLDEDPEHPGVNHRFADDDIGNLLIVTAAALVEGTEAPDAATSLIEYLLGPSAQEYFATETFEYPLAAGVEPAQDLPEISFRAVHVDFEQLGGGLEETRALISRAGLEG